MSPHRLPRCRVRRDNRPRWERDWFRTSMGSWAVYMHQHGLRAWRDDCGSFWIDPWPVFVYRRLWPDNYLFSGPRHCIESFRASVRACADPELMRAVIAAEASGAGLDAIRALLGLPPLPPPGPTPLGWV